MTVRYKGNNTYSTTKKYCLKMGVVVMGKMHYQRPNGKREKT